MNYNEYITLLERNKTIIVELLKGITQEQAAWKPASDRWSILEALNHLIDIEIEDFRHIFNMILTNPEEKWPSFNELHWISSRKYNEKDLKQSINNFITERNKSIQNLMELKNPDLNATHSGNGFKNKKMKAGDALAAWIAHDLFHIKQITILNWDILNESSKPYSTKYSGFYI